MKMGLLVVLMIGAALVVPGARAEDALLEGGKSPNGKFEVRIAPDEEMNYSIRIQSTAQKDRVDKLGEIGGWMTYEAARERDRALWHASSRVVAISDSGAKRSSQVYLWALVEGRFLRLELPGFEDNALGRVGALYSDRTNVVTPVKWEGKDLHLKYVFTANNLTQYSFSVVLSVDVDSSSAVPPVTMKSVEKVGEERDGP